MTDAVPPAARRHTQAFVFEHTWRIPAPIDEVFAVLAKPEDYPTWWPQVRRTERIDDESGYAWVRSLAPVTLHLTLTRQIEDAQSHTLRVALAGDLVGECGWQLTANGNETIGEFTQRVHLADGLIGTVADLRPARMVLRANHNWMMRSGERGLRNHLARLS